MRREIIRPEGFTANPILNQVARFGNLVFTAGMVGHDPATGVMAGDDIRTQAHQTMTNLQNALTAAGTSLDNALKVTAFVADLADRPAFNEVYVTFFTSDPPPRTCIQGGFLGEGILLEVEVVAAIPGDENARA